MNLILVIGFIVILAAIIISRALNARSQAFLSNEQQTLLVEALAPVRNSSLVVFAIAIIALIMIYKIYGNKSVIFSSIIIVFFLIYLFVFSTINYLKIKKLELPKEYIKLNLEAMILRIAGLIIFIICFAVSYFRYGIADFTVF